MEKIKSKELSSLVPNLDLALGSHSYIVNKALRGVSKDLEDITLVEYGGGLGFDCLLAKQLGVGKVIYLDIDPKMCELAKEVADEVGLKADRYICGDIDTLVSSGLKADVVTSNDVLEHIYDIDYFLKRLHLVCNKDAVLMHCSSANMFWYPYVKHSTKLHKQAETKGVKEYGTGPYLQDRLDIVKESVPGYSKETLKVLSKYTRGLVSKDIKLAVDKYTKYGYMEIIDHPTNTCDPYTGNWAERSMNPYYLAEMLSLTRFKVEVGPLPFEITGGLLSRLTRSTLNKLIELSNSLYFSHGYYLYTKYTDIPTIVQPIVQPKEKLYRHPRSLIFYLVGIPYELASLVRPRRSYYSTQF